MWQDNLDVPFAASDKLRWTCELAPEPPLAELLLTTGERAVGCVGVMPRRFFCSGEIVLASIVGDLAVDRAHRSVMPALKLVRAAKQVALDGRGLAYGLPNPAAVGVLKRCGFRELGSLTRYARVLRHGDYVKRRLSMPIVPAVGGAVLDGARLALMLPAAAKAISDIRFEWRTEISSAFDRLWESARGDYGVVAERTGAFLRWRFLQHPGDSCRIATIAHRSSPHELLAYAVVDRDGGSARVRDLFGHKRDLAALIDLLLPALILDGASSVSVRHLGDLDVSHTLLRRGFTAREARWPVVVDAAPPRPELTDPRRWHLTDADEDI